MEQEQESTGEVRTFQSDFSSLKELSALKKKNQSLPKLDQPVDLINFEMLEAELLNQRILPKASETLSQKIRHEVNLLSWHAKRLGISTDDIRFLVDVPAMLLKINSTENSSSSFNPTYLDLFASFILGKFDNANNPYEAGLNLVLKAILNTHSEGVLDQTTCILPISKSDFFKLIKN